MIHGVIPHVPDPHNIKEAAVGADDVVETCNQNSALADLYLNLQVTETALLTEVAHQVDEAKLCQHVSNDLNAQVLVLIQFHVEVSHQYEVLAPEVF